MSDSSVGAVNAKIVAPRQPQAAPAQQDAPVQIASVPDSWLPSGNWNAQVTSQMGTNDATVSRSQHDIDIHVDSGFGVDVNVQDMPGEKVGITVKLPWPLGTQQDEGTLVRTGPNQFHFTDDDGQRSADLWHMNDGRIHIQMRDPQQGVNDLYVKRD